MSTNQEMPETLSQTSASVQVHSTEYLSHKSQLKPEPFQSSIPIFGLLLVWFRSAWNSVSTRWYLQPLIQQQNEFNHLLVQEIHALNQGFLTLHSTANGLNVELQRLQGDLQLVRHELLSLHSDLQVMSSKIDESSRNLNDSFQSLLGDQQTLSNELRVVTDRTSALESESHMFRQHLNEITLKQSSLTGQVDEVSDRLTAGDREIATLVHDVGELTYSVIGLSTHLVESVESPDGLSFQQ